MKNFYLILLCTFLLGLSSNSEGAADKAPNIKIENAYIFKPIEGSNTTAGYGRLINLSDEAVELKIVSAEVFKAVELHKTFEKEGRMSMEEVESLNIPAKGSVELKPGGAHIMLFDANRDLKEGESVWVRFEAGTSQMNTAFKIVSRGTQN